MDRPGAQGPRGSQQTGSDRPCGLPAPPPAMPPERRGRGRRTRTFIARRAVRARPCAPSARPSSSSIPSLPVSFPLAGGLGGAVTPVPFPNTDVKGPRGDGTTPRSVGEQRAAGLLFRAPRLRLEAGGPFLFPGRGGARPSSCRALLCRASPC